jgi:hypothetical protein
MQDDITTEILTTSPLKMWNRLNESNSMQEEINSRLKAGDACYHLVRNFCPPFCYPKIQR